jgi:hypothetical protein
MAAVVSWYGPLIDLAVAASHVGGFVQLLATVRRVTHHQVMRPPLRWSGVFGVGNRSDGRRVGNGNTYGLELRPHLLPSLSQEQNATTGRTYDKVILEVGDDTRPSFSVSLWSSKHSSAIIAGDVLLLQSTYHNRTFSNQTLTCMFRYHKKKFGFRNE